MKVPASILLFTLVTVQANRMLQNPIRTKDKYKVGDDKIVGGTQVLDERKYPHQVSIDSGTRQCGGSLISDDAILTTATCLEIGDLFLITAGDIDKDVITGKEQTRNATRATVIIHPDFNPDLFIGRGNVAIIYLPIPFILNEYVNTILIEAENTTHNLHAGEEATVTGFGKTTDVSNLSPVLNEVDGLLIITNELCALTYGINIYPGIMCTETTNGMGPCGGDNGSALTQEINGRRIQIGIFSYGRIDGCLEEFPVAYERISIYRPWIDSIVPGLP